MSNIDNTLYIKRILLEAYTNNEQLIFDLATEISNNICSCSVGGISKDAVGLHLNFSCSSMNVNQNDIKLAIVHSIKNILYSDTFANDATITDFLSNDNNIYNLFSIMYVRGLSFTIII